MFELREDKLREALADGENDLVAFDPMTVDADDLLSFIEEAEDQELIAREHEAGTISIYRLACGSPRPMVAVATRWSVVVGGEVVFGTDPNDEEGTVNTLRGIVEAADALYEAKTRDHRELDRLAAVVNRYADDENEHDFTEVCNELVRTLQGTGRDVRFWTTDVC